MCEQERRVQMNETNEKPFVVVKFLSDPCKDSERVSCEFVCVPKSWIQLCNPNGFVAKVWYPAQDPLYIERKVRKLADKSDYWESFLCNVVGRCDTFDEAKEFILKEVRQNGTNKMERRNEDKINYTMAATERKSTNPKPKPVKKKKKPIKKMQPKSAVMKTDRIFENTLDAFGWRIASRSADTITLKRKAPAKSDKTVHTKPCTVNNATKSVNKVAGPPHQPLEWKINNVTHIHVDPYQDLRIQAMHEEKNDERNGMEKSQTATQNAPKANHSLHRETNAKFTTTYKMFSNNRVNTDNSCSTPKNDYIASASMKSTVGPPQFNGQKINEEQVELDSGDEDFECPRVAPQQILQESVPRYFANGSEDHYDNNYHYEHFKIKRIRKVPSKLDAYCGSICNDDSHNDIDTDEPRRKKQRKKETKEFVLPPEYDATDSRWTLKYRGPGAELVELIPFSGVYVRECMLRCHMRSAKDGKDLGRKLLDEVFTLSALSTCSWSGKPAYCYDPKGENVRPGLDEHARDVLLKFLIASRQEGWPEFDRQVLTQSMSSKLNNLRDYYTKLEDGKILVKRELE